MGKRHREAVREWLKTHPPPPGDAPPEVKEEYVRSAPSPRALAEFAAALLGAAARSNVSVPVILPDGRRYVVSDPGPATMTRPCGVCGHPVGVHGEDRPDCECCRKGLKIILPGTNMLDLALREQGLRRGR